MCYQLGAMQLPGFLRGTKVEARRRVAPFLKAIAAGEEPEVALVDAEASADVLVLDGGRTKMMMPTTCFHMYMPCMVATEPDMRRLVPQLIDWMLRRPWGPLGLLCQEFGAMRIAHVIPEGAFAAYLAAFVEWWPQYMTLGQRFMSGPRTGTLQAFNTPLMQALVRRGVTAEEFRVPFPGGTLENFVANRPGFEDVMARVAARRSEH